MSGDVERVDGVGDPQEAAREWATQRREERRLLREVDMTSAAAARVGRTRLVAGSVSLLALAGLTTGGVMWVAGVEFSERADALSVVSFLLLMVAGVAWVFLGSEQAGTRYRAARAREDLEFFRDVRRYMDGGAVGDDVL